MIVFAFTVDASNSEMPRPMASPRAVRGPAMPTAVSRRAGARSVRSVVNGTSVKGASPKTTTPTRSPWRRARKSSSTCFTRGEAVDRLARRVDEVLGVHRAGEIDEEQQVAGRQVAMQRRLDPLRAHQRGERRAAQQSDEHERGGRARGAATAPLRGSCPREGDEAIEEGHAQPGAALAHRRRQRTTTTRAAAASSASQG